ncbi:hypothetical protein RD055328_01510 [Companilactobacillus sp. RD055328]|uniref:hypothetical protein n=1 Tax=Companilactobacillus sp. RD055328 TaxID=2916634 RepID=UPI001FC83151|nr:hypothetical protein [Companilactobacillus sp. RD055328]GKQ42228.1 hypothetical protein RD055328_01510 [Companilactobacillus sp. RD055328]
MSDKEFDLPFNDDKYEIDIFESTDYRTVLTSIFIKVKQTIGNIIWEELNK